MKNNNLILMTLLSTLSVILVVPTMTPIYSVTLPHLNFPEI
ncbi:MAG: hypothetical protein ACPKQO_08510 [Nitrososphaeraceae archaeon]